MKTFRNHLEDDEHELMMTRRAQTGETLQYQIRQAIKEYCKKLKK